MIRTDVRDRKPGRGSCTRKRALDDNLSEIQRITALGGRAADGNYGDRPVFRSASYDLRVEHSTTHTLRGLVDNARARYRFLYAATAAACVAAIAWVVVLGVAQRGALLWLLIAKRRNCGCDCGDQPRFLRFDLADERSRGDAFAIPLHIAYFVYGSGTFALTFLHCRLMRTPVGGNEGDGVRRAASQPLDRFLWALTMPWRSAPDAAMTG